MECPAADALFEREALVARQARRVLTEGELPEGARASFAELLDAYETLLQEMRQMIRLSDRREASLSRANRRLEQVASNLSWQADHDALTGVYNKGAIVRLVGEALGDGPAGVVLFDIDHFKAVNDSYGHPCGDQVLRGVVELAQEGLVPGDIIGRLGGDEFMVLLDRSNLESCLSVALRFCRSIRQLECYCSGQRVQPSVSVGLAWCAAGTSFAEAYERADQALYAAKRGGRGRVEAAPAHVHGCSEEPSVSR